MWTPVNQFEVALLEDDLPSLETVRDRASLAIDEAERAHRGDCRCGRALARALEEAGLAASPCPSCGEVP
jgi:hypothetical protein